MQLPPVLYAEDEPDDVVFMERAFKKASVANPLVAVKDGQQAIDYMAGAGEFADRAAHPPPCLVLLDLKLPRKSGFDVLNWMQETGISIKVVVLTSSEKPEDVEMAKRLGATEFVVKPGSPARLAEWVASVKVRFLD